MVDGLSQRPELTIKYNNASFFDLKIVKADTFVFIYFTMSLCLSLTVKRVLEHCGWVSPDMTVGFARRFRLGIPEMDRWVP